MFIVHTRDIAAVNVSKYLCSSLHGLNMYGLPQVNSSWRYLSLDLSIVPHNPCVRGEPLRALSPPSLTSPCMHMVASSHPSYADMSMLVLNCKNSC